GLSISYAESYDDASGTWTDAAYDRVLAEVRRGVRAGGRLVFSVHGPPPSWGEGGGGWAGGGVCAGGGPGVSQKNVSAAGGARGVKQEARRGRFHYLPQETVSEKLRTAGYRTIDCRLSYAGQAYIFRAAK